MSPPPKRGEETNLGHSTKNTGPLAQWSPYRNSTGEKTWERLTQFLWLRWPLSFEARLRGNSRAGERISSQNEVRNCTHSSQDVPLAAHGINQLHNEHVLAMSPSFSSASEERVGEDRGPAAGAAGGGGGEPSKQLLTTRQKTKSYTQRELSLRTVLVL